MPHKVVITQSTAGRSGPPQTMLDVLNEAGLDVEVAACANENDLINAGKDADVMLVGTVPHTTRKVLESLPKLKMVGRSGVGVDSIDLDAATELGICVTNTPGINTSEVADHAMAMLLTITRQVPELNKYTKEGAWSDDPSKLMAARNRLRRIAGTTVGIYGFGNIGRAFSNRIKGFGPEKIAIIVEALTDNKNRTASNIRTIFQKFGGNLGESGTTSHQFRQLGVIRIDKKIITDDEILELAIKSGAEDCLSNQNNHEILIKKESFYKVKQEIEKKIKEFTSSGIEWIPINKISLNEEKTKSLINFLETLENDDDVQHVYANLEINSNFTKEISK